MRRALFAHYIIYNAKNDFDRHSACASTARSFVGWSIYIPFIDFIFLKTILLFNYYIFINAVYVLLKVNTRPLCYNELSYIVLTIQ